MLTPIPLLIIPFAVFNILVFLTAGLDWSAIVATLALPSGATWQVSIGDGFLGFSLLIFLFELMKATRIATRSIVDHFLALLLTGAATAEFLLVPQAASSIFALLIALMVVDFLIGLSASIRTPRRRARPAPPAPKTSPAPKAEAAPQPEPRPEPVARPAPVEEQAPSTRTEPPPLSDSPAKPTTERTPE